MGEEWPVLYSDKWDQRFLSLAQLISTWSKDPSTKVGSCVVRPDKTIASVGYNGFPQKLSDAPELYADRETKLSRVIHAEMNAIIFCKEPIQGYTIYTYPFMPCDRCTVMLIQLGVSRMVFPTPTEAQQKRWHESFSKSFSYLEEAGISWSQIDRV